MKRRALLAFTVVLGCAEAPAAEAGAGTFHVEGEQALCSATIELAGGEPVRGENRFLVELSPAGAELTGASGLMVAHGHGSEGEIVSGTPPEAVIDLFMAGRWDMTFAVSVDGASDELRFAVDVP